MSGGFAVGCPAGYGPPTWGLLHGLLALQTPENQVWSFIRVAQRPVDEARNEIVRQFLRMDREWLLFLDTDASIHPQTLIRLHSWGKPVVAAMAFTRYTPPVPTIYANSNGMWAGQNSRPSAVQIDETLQWILDHPALASEQPVVLNPAPADSLRQVAFTGGHCLLVQRHVLEQIRPPWFVNAKPGERKTPSTKPGGTGEDYGFCQRIHALRYPIYVDRSVMAGHLWHEDHMLGAIDFMAYMSVTNRETGKVDIGKEDSILRTSCEAVGATV